MTRRPSFNADAFARIKREYDGGGADDGYYTEAEAETEQEQEQESLALPPSRIAAIIDGLDIDGLPTPVELAALATGSPSEDEAPTHNKVLSRSAGSQLSKPGRAKRALKTEVHELQQMVDRMQAQVTGAACEIQELTRLVSQLVAKKQREEAEEAIKQEQMEQDEMEMDRCLAMGDVDAMVREQQLMMDRQQQFDDMEMKRRANANLEAELPIVAAFPMCAVKQGTGNGRRG